MLSVKSHMIKNSSATRAAFLILVMSVVAVAAGGSSSGGVSKLSPAIAQQIIEVATSEGLDPFLVLEVMRRESAFKPRARSHKGAGGLMQLMPATAQRFGITNPYDPQQAITGGCRYLKYLMGLYPNRLDLVLAAYNAGEGSVAKYGNSIPPYRETQAYVAEIMKGYRRARELAENARVERVPARARRPLTNSEVKRRLAYVEVPALGSPAPRGQK